MDTPQAQDGQGNTEYSLLPGSIRSEGSEQKDIPETKAYNASQNIEKPKDEMWKQTNRRLKAIWEFAKTPESTNVTLAVATVVIAVFTIVLAVASIQTLSEIRGGGKQMDRQIAALSQQMSATAALAIEARISAGAARSAAETADKSLQQSRSSFRLDQRPFVWVERFNTKSIAVGQPIAVDVYFVNYGRTPARELATFTHAAFGKPAEQLCDVFMTGIETKGTSVLGSGKSDIWKTAINQC